MTKHDALQALGLALFFGPLLALTLNGVNPFGALTWVLVAAGFTLTALNIGGARVLHSYAQRRSTS